MSAKDRKGFKPKVQTDSTPATASQQSKTDAYTGITDNHWRTGLYWFISVSLMVIIFGWGPGYVHPYNKAFYLLVLVATISLIGLWCAVGTKAIKLVTTPFFLGAGIWLAAKLLTTLTSMGPTVSFWGTYEVWADGFMYALAVAVIAAVIITLRLETNRVARLIHILGIPAVVFGLITISQAIQEGFFYQQVRPETPLLNPDYYLSFGLLFWPLAVVLFISKLKNRQFARSILYAVSTLILSASIFVSMPTHLQTILLPWFMDGKKDTTFGSTDTKPINASNFTEDNANTERWAEWGIGLKLGSDRPLIGTGPSTTGEAFIARQKELNLSTWDHDVVIQHPHSDIIEQFSQEGLLGALAYIFFWAVIVWVVVKNRRRVEPAAKPYAVGLGLGLLLWLGFNQLLFTTVFPGLIEWVWLALLMSLLRTAKATSNLWPKLLLGVISIFLAIISIFIIHGYIDDAYVFHAESVDLTLKSNSGRNLTTAERINLSETDASQEDAAADDLPYVSYYQNQAALASINLYMDVQSAPASFEQIQSANALKYARRAVADDPYSPEFAATLGGIEYYLAPVGSIQERAGIALINRAIDMTPDAVPGYSDAAKIAALKKNYPLARSFIHRGLKIAKTAKDRSQLSSYLANLPAS